MTTERCTYRSFPDLWAAEFADLLGRFKEEAASNSPTLDFNHAAEAVLFRLFVQSGAASIEARFGGLASALRLHMLVCPEFRKRGLPERDEDRWVGERVIERYETLVSFPTPPEDLTLERFCSDGEVLDGLLTAKPQVIAFGEYHRPIPPDGYQGGFSDVFFGERLLPVLRDRGYCHLVLECLPYGIPETELRWFAEKGKTDPENTPLLDYFLRLPGHGDICRNLLESARKLGVQVHPGGASLVDFRSFVAGGLSTEEMVRSNARYSQRALSEVTEKYGNALFYGGAMHNDLRPDTIQNLDPSLAFGAELSRKYRYLEIDLFLPSLVSHHIQATHFNDSTLTRSLLYYYRFIPRQGQISVVTRGKDSHTLVYPYARSD